MKHLIMTILMLSFFANLGLAAETNTECAWMREQNERNNPKANLSASKPKPKQVRGASIQ